MLTATTVDKQESRGTTLTLLNGAMAANALRALSDEFSRRILVSVITEGKTVQDISLEEAVPLSTCYRRAHELVKEGLLLIERIVVTGDGKRYAVYRSSFKAIEISSDFTALYAYGEVNEGVSEKLRERSFQMSYAQQAMGVN